MTREHPIRGRRFWLVGASSGIGAALATELVDRGAQVAISARRADDLEAVAAGTMTVTPLDVTDRDAVHQAAGVVTAALGGLDVVIWCAGYWRQFDATAWDADDFARHVEVNLLGLNNVLAAVVPGMVAAGQGHLVGIASVAGYRGLAGAEAYGATKAAQINLLEALRGALRGHGVRVTTVCPGFVRTEMTESNDFPMPFIIDADAAARAIADGIERRRTEIVFPLSMAALMKAARLVPVRAWPALTSRAAASSGTDPRPGGRFPVVRDPTARSTLAPEAEVPDKTTSWIIRPPDDATAGRRTIEPGRSPVEHAATANGEEVPVARLHLLPALPTVPVRTGLE